jgi:hypothetical protein
MSTERDMDQFEGALRDYVRQLVAFDQGHRVTESLEAARQNFRAKLRAAFGLEEGAANPTPTETGP